MKKSIYITLALAGILSMNSCNDDEFLPGNPSMEIKAENADALFGDSLPFTIKASDVDVPLSTLKAQLFYGEEQVSETVIRTKTSGSDYTGKIYIPYYANIPNGKATLKYILQNIHFTTTEQETELTLARPDFPYLTLVDEEGQEYRMDRQSMYHYSVSGDFSQKMKAYIKTPKVGEHGNELTFGWEDNTIAVGFCLFITELSQILSDRFCLFLEWGEFRHLGGITFTGDFRKFLLFRFEESEHRAIYLQMFRYEPFGKETS